MASLFRPEKPQFPAEKGIISPYLIIHNFKVLFFEKKKKKKQSQLIETLKLQYP